MNGSPTSHFITLPNRPIVRENGEISQGPLQLHYWQWQGHQPTVLFCHGGALHGRCYDLIIRKSLSGFHIIALDFRGHGQSQKHPLPYPYRWFGEDVYQFIEVMNLSKHNLIGIGYSLGGHALTLAAAIAPRQLFQSLLLLDPAIYAPDVYVKADEILKILQMTAAGKKQWSSVEDMVVYMDKPDRLSSWSKEVLCDYCRYALDEKFQLQCTTELAAYLYLTTVESDSNIYENIKNSKFIHDIPIHVVRSSKSFIHNKTPLTPTSANLYKYFQKGRDTQLKDTNHSFPMEQPEIIIDLVEETKHLHSHL